MTLQYRIRSKYEDRLWRQRVYLGEQLVLDAFDRWCLSDAEFPTRSVVAGVLYLFSPRCDPFKLSPYRLGERLGGVVGTPAEEYRATWPGRTEAQGRALIDALTAGIETAVSSWDGGGGPSCGSLAEGAVGEIVAQQYVVFHHCETTRRDTNPWGI